MKVWLQNEKGRSSGFPVDGGGWQTTGGVERKKESNEGGVEATFQGGTSLMPGGARLGSITRFTVQFQQKDQRVYSSVDLICGLNGLPACSCTS